MSRRRIGASYAVIRLDDPDIDEKSVMVKEVVSTFEKAVAEVDRLNALSASRGLDSRYSAQITRHVDATDGAAPPPPPA